MKKGLCLTIVLAMSGSLFLSSCVSVPQQSAKKHLFGLDKPSCDSAIIKIPTGHYKNESHDVIVSLEQENKNVTMVYTSSEKYANNLMECFDDNQINVFTKPFEGKKRINVNFSLRDLNDNEKQSLLQKDKVKAFTNDTYTYKYFDLDIKRLPYRANLDYPTSAKKMRYTGIVKLYFTINEAGRATNIRVINSPRYPALEESAIKALKSSIFDTSQFPHIPYKAIQAYSFQLR
ncbi:MAG: hypothetical protein CSA42_01175 [Gammaproteobacteria bacterium]|nr:MAG: hypothetical protein CSA42_01175 [Gammaproteobacteria bacterium]